MKDWKNNQWIFNKDCIEENAAPGVVRKVLAFTDELMCVENHFEKGGIGALHSHPLG